LVTKQSHWLLCLIIRAAKLKLAFSSAPLTQ
jgi:hypothetical protein